MCERYVTPERSDAEQEFRVAHPWWRYSPSFNVPMTRNVPVVRMFQGESEGIMLPWRLIPHWAEGDVAKGCATHIPAASIEHSNLCNDAWNREQRCILPLSGFYTWRLTPAGYRQPYFVRTASRAVFGIAAVWDRSVSEDDDVIESCAMVTVAPNPLLAHVHNTSARMPAILHPEDHEIWLNGTAAAAKAVLHSYPADDLRAHAVSPRINSLKYDDASLTEPVEESIRRRA